MTRHHLLLVALLAAGSLQAQTRIQGFTPANAVRQAEAEKLFDAGISAANQDAWMQFLASRPHHVGSPQAKVNADYMAERFRSWGYEVELARYDVLFPTPKTRVLELLGPTPYRALLEEPTLAEDRTSGQKAEQLPSYNAFSGEGDVTAELVFVNRGIPEDYEMLERMGISVKGRIVIAKYGGSWRGIKPKLAQENGAVGCLIYSDPEDDGYTNGDAYPKGPWRPEQAVQRGSVMDMPVAPGDPGTPGYASLPGARRIPWQQAKTIMKIPVLPISWGDALPLLQSLAGPVVPAAWRGALPITYHAGPSAAKVHLKLDFYWDVKPAYNVIATLKGSAFPDEWVIRGNHHDAWVNGAADPLSGMVALMEEARMVAEISKKGYAPKRTLKYCAWDAEEPALLGSTEWVEDHAEELRQKAVVYINTDGNSRGFISASGSHTLEPMYNEVISAVTDPQYGVSVRERRHARALVEADRNARARLMGNSYQKMSALGAGSDYSGFIQHLGIASVNLGYGGEGSGGEYHSIYDSYDHFTRFKDPGFAYGSLLAKTAGRMSLRIANAEVLPIDFGSFHETVAGYAAEVKAMADNLRQDVEVENRLIRDNIYVMARDLQIEWQLPKPRALVPFLDFSPLDNALASLKTAAQSFRIASAQAPALPAEKRASLNTLLLRIEQHLLTQQGLPRRPWYRHQVYAPGFYTGYGVKTLPGVREAIEQHNWQEALEQIRILAETLRSYTRQVEAAVAILSS
ncbi:MAG: M28 family peptidase [Bacteroidetes bacterium]|nr:M28 family peptidase [Bacteroidota bacterium]